MIKVYEILHLTNTKEIFGQEKKRRRKILFEEEI